MSEVTSDWIRVGERDYQRTELYGPSWRAQLAGLEQLVAAPFGGPLLVLGGGCVHVHTCAGAEIAKWQWKNGGRVMACGWSLREEAVFVADDGAVFLYDLFGQLKKTFGMGKEAKDLKVRAARVFARENSTGVAVCTGAGRFLVVNNVHEPRVRKMFDVEWGGADTDGGSAMIWEVLGGGGAGGSDQRHPAKLLVARDHEVLVVLQAEQTVLAAGISGDERATVAQLAVAADGRSIAVLYTNSKLWLGTLEGQYRQLSLDLGEGVVGTRLAWCAHHALLVFPADRAALCQIVSATEDAREPVFLADFVTAVQELDGLRVFSLGGQDFWQRVPPALVQNFSISSNSPGTNLRLAAEAFRRQSHQADEYVRLIKDRLEMAVTNCIECAGQVHDPLQQKALLRAAQFGQSFVAGASSSAESADTFHDMCVTLRVLNALRHFRVGIPLTLRQYRVLTPEVLVDRLLARRLYPLALKICQLLKLPAGLGENRVLAHWACYKVSSGADDDAAVARAISQRLGHHPQISYCDIAAKAAECGKKALSIKLLEHEIRVSRQVPLLVQLGQEAVALQRALSSGNRDLAFSVILHLKTKLPSSDFHFLIRKYPLGKILYQNYCRRQRDDDALEDWFVQEDDFVSLAHHYFAQTYAQSRTAEGRMAQLHRVQEQLRKAKCDAFQGLADENHRLLKYQAGLEDKLTGASFAGKTVHQTILDLLATDQLKLAEKVRQDFKVSERRFAWLRARALARRRDWPELRRFVVKQKKQRPRPLSNADVVRIVRRYAGDQQAKDFLDGAGSGLADDADFLTYDERFDLYTEFGMFVEAANAAFRARSVESLNALEALVVGKDEAVRVVAGLKARLVSKQ